MRGLSFDYISFRRILESSMGARYQSSLASALELSVTTVNNWCSSRCGAGPSLANRGKIDDFFKKKKFPFIDWQSLMLPIGMDAETFHAQLNKPSQEYVKSPKDDTDLFLQILNLQKDILKLKKELNEKELEIYKYKTEAVESKAEVYKLKKQIDILKK